MDELSVGFQQRVQETFGNVASVCWELHICENYILNQAWLYPCKYVIPHAF